MKDFKFKNLGITYTYLPDEGAVRLEEDYAGYPAGIVFYTNYTEELVNKNLCNGSWVKVEEPVEESLEERKVRLEKELQEVNEQLEHQKHGKYQVTVTLDIRDLMIATTVLGSIPTDHAHETLIAQSDYLWKGHTNIGATELIEYNTLDDQAYNNLYDTVEAILKKGL